ncbi:MAG: NADH-quinone oxidoreductase subunit C [Thermodesulfobacteriota bacterium]|nr:NADH-quinone oxidoreductase subunit C [Thermodesulfobacteriota bacterium]
MSKLADLVERLKEKFPQAVEETVVFRDEYTVRIVREHLLEVAQFLKEDPEYGFNFLSDLCGVDYMGREPRFEVVYHLYSMEHKHRLRMKVSLAEGDLSIPSVTPVWKTANWHERECFDLLGIIFTNHPDMRRILTPEGFTDHPLRKDFPLRGR